MGNLLDELPMPDWSNPTASGYIYLVSEDARLLRFNASTLKATVVGPLICAGLGS